MKNNIKKEKGITLIALVITIIVLLILAGVSIAMLTGNNGLLTKAGEASKNTNKCKEVEQARLDIMAIITEKGGENPTEREIKEILGKYFESVPINIDDLMQELITKDGRNQVKLSEILDGVTIKEDYIGCYADIDNNGVVDGIIYADMKVGNTKPGTWLGYSWQLYSIPKIEDKTSIKSYEVSTKIYEGQTTAGKYKANDGFGERDVIVPIEDSPGTKDRFYVMQLEDFKSNSYDDFYWYYEAGVNGSLDRMVSRGTDDFGKGKQYTIEMINDWNNNTDKYGEQTTASSGKDSIDLWGAIQDGQYELVTSMNDSGKWFVPSMCEWHAFGNELGIVKSNLDDVGLLSPSMYWSSSQFGRGANVAWCIWMRIEGSTPTYYKINSKVRLSATF